jgi:hypothetical protein
MPDFSTVLPAPKLPALIGIRSDAHVITLAARTSSLVARCPARGKRSARVHSRYTRTISDLPRQGIPVTIRLRVRRFFCEVANCDRTIFAERLPGLAAHYARRTERLDRWFTHVSFALGGEACSRLLKDLGIVVSGDTYAYAGTSGLSTTRVVRDSPMASKILCARSTVMPWYSFRSSRDT